MRFPSSFIAAFSTSIVLAGCSDLTVPNGSAPSPGAVLSASLTPSRNLEVILRGAGFGHVKFRQPKDDATIVFLDTWVRDLAPNTTYLLQRAVDPIIDDNCTGPAPGESWLTLGQGLTPRAITTDEKGTGREALFRILSPTSVGTAFDIHFRVIEQSTGNVVLESACYQFVVSL
jgi:hypothetical protein